jgi:arylsulfatase A-like enzyme
MIRHMDEGIGALLAKLPENTLVVFTSDNGGERFSDTWPLVGKKMDLLEGGIRVPYIVRWPGKVPPGKTTAQLAMTMDWVPTFLEAAGVAPHPDYSLDGTSLLNIIQKPDNAFERELFWRMKFREQRAVRSGKWKWLSIEGNEFLYDLATDSRERANLRYRHPEVFNRLRDRYAAWHATVPPIPEDAKVSLVYGPADMAQPS